jgi:hypothetical protein
MASGDSECAWKGQKCLERRQKLTHTLKGFSVEKGLQVDRGRLLGYSWQAVEAVGERW